MTNSNYYALAIKPPADYHDWVLLKVSSQEYVSKYFKYQLSLLIPKQSNNIKNLLGKAITFSITDASNNHRRHYHGHVIHIKTGYSTYKDKQHIELKLVPKLQLLDCYHHYHLFKDISNTDLVIKLCHEQQINYQSKLNKTYDKQEYIVQYHESKSSFIKRLLASDNIHYYFSATEKVHTLCLVDTENSLPIYNVDLHLQKPYFSAQAGADEILSAQTLDVNLQAGMRIKFQGDYYFIDSVNQVFSDPTIMQVDKNKIEHQIKFTAKPITAFSKQLTYQKPKAIGVQPAIVKQSAMGKISVDFAFAKFETSIPLTPLTPAANHAYGTDLLAKPKQEVIIGFFEQNNAKPYVLGSVYNDANQPANLLPYEQSKSSFISAKQHALVLDDDAKQPTLSFNSAYDWQEVAVNYQLQAKQHYQAKSLAGHIKLHAGKAFTVQSQGIVLQTPAAYLRMNAAGIEFGAARIDINS